MAYKKLFAAAALLLAPIGPAAADVVTVTYAPAGQTEPNFSTLCATQTVCDYGTEGFSSWNGNNNYVASFAGVGIGTASVPTGVAFSGTYKATPGTSPGQDWLNRSQSMYGGAGPGTFVDLRGGAAGGAGNSYSVTLSPTGVPGVNYFGFWVSAVDALDSVAIYDGANVVARITGQDIQGTLGSCGGTVANPYCGNPTSQFLGADPNQMFVYVNIFDVDGYITKVKFSAGGGSNFETDNHAVAYLGASLTPGTGTPTVINVSEPGSIGVLGAGLIGIAACRRRRFVADRDKT